MKKPPRGKRLRGKRGSRRCRLSPDEGEKLAAAMRERAERNRAAAEAEKETQ